MVALIALTLALLTACAPPDHWEVFDPEYEKRFDDEADRSIEVDDALKPGVADAPPLPSVVGDGPLELSVEEAALLALRNNRDLAVEQLNPVIVGAFELIERGVYDPELFAEAQYAKEEGEEIARSTGESFSVQARDTEAIAGIRQRLPTGTTVEGTVAQGRSASNRAPEQQEARLGLTVTQSLLQGFGPAVNLARIRQAELDTVASVYELRGFTEALLAEVETAYWNYTLARQRIAIFERSLAVAEQQAGVVQQRIDVGALAETEAAAAKVEVALRQQALIDARSELEERRLRLLRLLDPDPAGSLDRQITAVTAARIDPEPIEDVQDRLALAERIRPDLNEARARLAVNRLETIVTRNGLLPRLDLFIAVGKTGFGDTFTESYKNLDGPTHDFAAGVGFSHFLGNRAAEGRDLAARATRQQAAAAVANLRQLVRLDVRLAINEVERAREQIAASTITRQLQEQTVRAEQQRFEVGASTSLLVAQAQRDLLQTQINEVEAVVTYRIALVNLYLAEGSLLERRGVSVGAAPREFGE